MPEYITINPFKLAPGQALDEIYGPSYGNPQWSGLQPFDAHVEYMREVHISALCRRRMERFNERVGCRVLRGYPIRSTDPECYPGATGTVERIHLVRVLNLRYSEDFPSGVGVLMALDSGQCSCWFDSGYIEVIRGPPGPTCLPIIPFATRTSCGTTSTATGPFCRRLVFFVSFWMLHRVNRGARGFIAPRNWNSCLKQKP